MPVRFEIRPDHVLPLIPYRQFVVSFPMPLRFWIHTNKRLFARVHDIVIKEILRRYDETAAGQGIPGPSVGTMSFTQRWGSAANLTVRLLLGICGDLSRVLGKQR